jgi:DNA polymerase I-like protein with 3'-5' exonuclease and polymerase domains
MTTPVADSIPQFTNAIKASDIRFPGHPDLANIIKLDLGTVPMTNLMERAGMEVDLDHLKALSSKIGTQMVIVSKEVQNFVPQSVLDKFVIDSINLESSEQVSDLLFNALGIGRGHKLKMTKGGGKRGERVSTGKKQMETYREAHDVMPLMLEYRELSKLKSTYVDKMPRIVVWHPKGPECPLCGFMHWTDSPRIHTSIVGTRTATGRYSSRNPNLQNIPTRTDLGREVRAAFVAGDGYRIVSCDYSQIELRLLAHFACEMNMIEVFMAGGDLHTHTACLIFGKKPNEVDPMFERLPCKNVNFAICLAKGQRVLTDHGLVNIENVTKNMRLWDGVEWIKHDGVIFKGIRKVINYDGITATPDHKVWTSDGRVLPISQASAKELKLAITAYKASPIGYTHDSQYRDRENARPRIQSGKSSLFKLRHHKVYHRRQSHRRKDQGMFLPKGIQVPKPSEAITVAYGEVLGNPRTMHMPNQSELRELRREGDRESIPVNRGIRDLCTGEPSTPDIQRSRYWENRQQWPLRAWEHSIRDENEEPEEYSAKRLDRLQGREDCSNRPPCPFESRLHRIQSEHNKDNQTCSTGSALGGDNAASSTAEMEEAEVYDILNAGPRRRFTCEGKLVSNCYGETEVGLFKQMQVTKPPAKDPRSKNWAEIWSLEKCAEFINQWHEAYPAIKPFTLEQHYRARRYGYVWDLFGGVRRIPHARSYHGHVQEEGNRAAGNDEIQGTAAGVMKLAIVLLGETVDERLKWSRPLMTIHDELLFQVDEDNAEAECWFVKMMMEEAGDMPGFRVPIKADGKVSKEDETGQSRWKK